MTDTMIEIYLDPICPWCLIGKRRLDHALVMAKKARPEASYDLRWRVFQLNPTMPTEGMDRAAYLATKFGGFERAHEVYDVIQREGLKEGIEFAFDRIRRTPNTLAAHGLIRLAQSNGHSSSLVERLFEAYFIEGLDIGDDQILMEIAKSTGLDPEQVQSFFAGDRAVDSLAAEDAAARALGITGVPFFIINKQYSVSGAVAPEVLLRALELSWQS
ncbi:MAG: DsbA family oxidoreductase [Alphaproteobacteria bacterium]|nr:DsbA family oxidoreductase [Alphaproteobacteria bacterium]